MPTIYEKMTQIIPKIRDEVKNLRTNYGSKVIDQTTVDQVYGGMRDMKSLVCDTSYVDPATGLIIRDKPLAALTEKLPEEIFYLLVTGELPDSAGLEDLQKQFNANVEVPAQVWKTLEALPKDSHPMAMLSLGILAMEGDSKFRKAYDAGMKKDEYWKATLDDSITLIGRLPALAAGIYRMRFNKGPRIAPKKDLDLGANYAHMMGIPDPKGEFAKLMSLYLVLHSDHESGNVSAHTAHCVASALSDPYYAVSAGLNGLAGPLHGLANQECLKFVLNVRDKFKGVPTEKQLEEFCWETLKTGVIPGYGHAVLRAPDPRFVAFRDFGLKYCTKDEPFQIVDMMFKVVPDVLKKQGKAKNPWPNVDAGSGALLYHYGITEFDYYTVLFGVSRAMGLCAQMVISRIWGEPLERPKSVTTQMIKDELGIK